MKQLLVLAVALAAVNAQASRARVLALGNSSHLVDTQTVYTNPSDIFRLPSDYVTLETGATQSTAPGVATPALPAGLTAQNANAEGMIVRTHGDAKLGLSLGHQSANASSWGLRNFASAALQVNQQNPLELTYGMKAGDVAWAGTLVYSNFNNKQAAVGALSKESSAGIRLGANAGPWDASLRVGLTNTVEANAGNKFTGTSAIGIGGGYWMDSMYFSGDYATAGAKEETAAGADVTKPSTQTIRLGALNSIKKDGSELFYSASLLSTELKETVTDTKVTTLSLPVLIGMELDAASWLTFRGSISQTVLLSQYKTVTAGTTTAELDPSANNTTVALGAGLKFNKLTVDGTLAAATTQVYSSANLLAQIGATYWF